MLVAGGTLFSTRTDDNNTSDQYPYEGALNVISEERHTDVGN